MEIVLAGLLEKSIIESLVDGEGVRLVVFTNGCPHHCRGCHNSDTWDIKKGISCEIEAVVEYLKKRFYSGKFKGITISGGDPLYQKEATAHLLKRIKESIPEADIWCFTGYLYENVKDYEAIQYIDVLMDGRFEADKRYPKKPFRGSNNQRLLRLQSGKVISEE